MGFKLTAGGILSSAPGSMQQDTLYTPLDTSQNNWSPTDQLDNFATANLIIVTPSQAVNLTGLAGGADGRQVQITNVGAFTISLLSQNAGSLPENRFSAAVALAAGLTVTLEYLGSINRWVPVNLGGNTQGGGGGGAVGADPTAQVGPAVVNGVAVTFMRSDAAPPLANTTVAAGVYTYSAITVDAQGRITAAASGAAPVAPPVGANPTASLGLTAVNGAAATFLRSDGAPALSQAIVPTWTGEHFFTGTVALAYPAGTTGAKLGNGAGGGEVRLMNAGGAADTHMWSLVAGSATCRLRAANDAGVFSDALQFNRTGGTVTLSIISGAQVRLAGYGAGTVSTDASGNIVVTSDSRIKDNVRDFQRGLAELMQVNPVYYGYTPESGLDQTKKDYVGILAQDIQRILPEAIGTMRIETSRTLKVEHMPDLVAYQQAAAAYDAMSPKQKQAVQAPPAPDFTDEQFDIEYDPDPPLTVNKDALLMLAINAIKELSARLSVLEGK